jgi:hypothetical protein
VTAQGVEEVFERNGLIWELRVGGRVIRGTAEHPFFRESDGWVALNQLRVGDRLKLEDGSWTTIEGIQDTGVYAAVYNFRVSEYHTYFVGDDEQAIWAHNEYTGGMTQREAVRELRAAGLTKHQATRLARLGDEAGIQGNRLVEESAALARAERATLFPDPGYYGSNQYLAFARGNFSADARPLTSHRYSVATEVQLRPGIDFPGRSDRQHFSRANRDLHERMQADPQFAAMLEGLYPGLTQAVSPGARGAFRGVSPTSASLVWHHHPTRPGVLQLVPDAHHGAPGPVQQTLHPNGQGGMENWGGVVNRGRGATPPSVTGPTLFD